MIHIYLCCSVSLCVCWVHLPYLKQKMAPLWVNTANPFNTMIYDIATAPTIKCIAHPNWIKCENLQYEDCYLLYALKRKHSNNNVKKYKAHSNTARSASAGKYHFVFRYTVLLWLCTCVWLIINLCLERDLMFV